MIFSAQLRPVEPRLRERCKRSRVWKLLARRLASELGEMGEFLAPSYAHRIGETRLEIAKECERPEARPLLTHEQQRDLRRQQHDGNGRVQRGLGRVSRQPRPERAVSDLVMVLQKRDKCRRGQFGGRFAAGPSTAKRRRCPLEGKSFGERTAEALGRLGSVVTIIAPVLASDEEMQDVVKIVVPLRGISLDLATRAHQAVRLVAVVLKDEMYFPAGDVLSHALGDLIDDVGQAVVDDCVDRVETQPIEVELFEPIKGVVYKKVAHRSTVP